MKLHKNWIYVILYIIMTIIRTPGIEPELLDWKSNSLPLTYVRTDIYYVFSLNSFIEKIFIK